MSAKSWFKSIFRGKKTAKDPEIEVSPKEEKETRAVAAVEEEKPQAVREAVAKPKREEPVARPVCSDQRIHYILRRTHMSEKTVDLVQKRTQYTYEVAPDATCAEVKVAVERLIDVKVLEVRICNVHGKRKRDGTRASWRKAIVRLEPGQDIDVMEMGS